MRILLIKPPSQNQKTFSLPLGLAYIASYLEKNNYQVKIIDSRASKYKKKDIKKEIKKFNPDAVGATAITTTLFDAFDVVKMAKEYNPNCLTVLGGAHPTVRAKETLELCKDVDIIVRGEGEITFADILEKYETKNGNDLSKVQGITFRDNGKIIQTKDRPPIEDLDALPFPAYHLLNMDDYKYWYRLFSVFEMEKNSIPFSYMHTSRGCPYNCAFCASRALWGQKCRSRSPENIIDEIKILKERYKRKVIDITDDTFTLDKKKVIKLCDLIRKEDFDISFICCTRANLFDKEIATALKKAGFLIVYFGLESGVQKTLDYLCKGFTVQDSINAIKTAKNAGLKIVANFIIGVPGETKKDINTTINFAKKLKLNHTSFTVLLPFPGTKIYEDAKRKNPSLNEKWDIYNYKNISSLIHTPGLSNIELKGLLIKANILCNLTPSGIFYDLFKELPKKGFYDYNKFDDDLLLRT